MRRRTILCPHIEAGGRAGSYDKPGPRDLIVTYYNGTKPPCPCIADGVMIATHASPGQGTLQISPETAPNGMAAVILIKNRKTGEGLRYTVADEWLPKILAWLKADSSERYDAMMSAEALFQVEQVK